MTSSTEASRPASSSRVGHLERHPRRRERALGAHDPLRDGRLRDEIGARDLPRGQPAEQAQRERDPRLGREHRMAGGEDQAQEIVVERVVGLRGEVGQRHASPRRSSSRASSCVLRSWTSARRRRSIARCLADGHEPGARVVRDARLGPLLERGDERLLREVLGEADVAHDPGEAADQPRRLDPPDGLDRAVDVASVATCQRVALGLAAHLRLALAQLGGELVAEVLGLEHRPDLDHAVIAVGVRDPLDPLDRLVERLDLPQPVARQQLLGLGERAVDHLALAARERDADALRARMQPLAGEHHARLDQLLVELGHLREELLARHLAGFALLVRLDQDHDAHVVPPGG